MSHTNADRVVSADPTDLEVQIAAHRLNAHKLSAAISEARAAADLLDAKIRQISDLNELVRINNVTTRLMICADILDNPDPTKNGLTHNIDCADHLAFELARALPNMWEAIISARKDCDKVREHWDDLNNYLAAVALGVAVSADRARSKKATQDTK